MSDRERKVGLGRVVEDRMQRHDRRSEDAADRAVERDSADSFPASDPPTWMSDPATPGEGVEGIDDAPAEPPQAS